MGIVNTTPDSFSDGGLHPDTEAAVSHALRLEAEGADIVDFGGESTRPGAQPVNDADETARVVPAIHAFAARRQRPETLISVDTSKPAVTKAALEAGADILNDVTGLRDPALRAVAAGSDCGIVIMHMLGEPRTMQKAPHYDDVVADVRAFFEDQLQTCAAEGIDPQRIALDPGIGFGKSLEHNLTLLRELPALRVGDRPLLLGVSRKSFIGKILGTDEIEAREWPTVALTAQAREQGAEIVRVHQVLANVHAMRMVEAVRFAE